jgi:LysR family transcriptional regulator, hydrogen peroxide-inducible genes activator
MNLRDLEYLVAIADLLHFGKASERCNSTQPTLSMQMKKLEEYLGAKIFERTNKKVIITDVGEKIIEKARNILNESKEIKDIAKSAQDPFACEMRLGAFPTLAPYFFPKLVKLMRDALPKVKLLLLEEKTQLLLERLISGSLDAIFVALPVDDNRLDVFPLFEDPFLLAVYHEHKLSKKRHVRIRDLKGESLLLLEEGHCLRDQALKVCDLIGISEYNGFRATSLETLRQMVASQVGITLLPNIAIGNDETLVYIPFEEFPPSRKIGIVYRKRSVRKKCIQVIQDLLCVRA